MGRLSGGDYSNNFIAYFILTVAVGNGENYRFINAPQGLPAFFATLMSILEVDGARIIEDQTSSIEAYAMLDSISPILQIVPFNTHDIIVVTV